MAKVTYGAIVSDIRGNIRGNVYTIYRGTHIIRTHCATPYNPNTTRQQQIRTFYTTLLGCWWNLPIAHQELWEKYGQTKKDTRTGIGAFLQSNMRLLAADNNALTQVDHPPQTPSTPTAAAGFTWHFVGASIAQIQWSTPLSTTTYIQALHRLNWDYSPSYNVYWAITKTVASNPGLYNWLHTYPTNTKISLKLKTMDTYGRISPFTHKLSCLVPTRALSETWVNTGNLSGATNVLSIIETSDQTLYAGTAPNGDIFKSTDSGVTWTNTGNLLNATDVYTLLEASDGTLYAGTAPNGDIFKSTDNGDTWTNTGNLLNATDVYSIIEASDGALFAGTAPNGDVFKSTDGGTTWTNTGNLLAATYVYGLLEASDNALYAATRPAGNVYKSTDGGTSWANTGDLLNATFTYFILEAADGTLFAGTRPNGDVFKSIDGGVTWTNTGNLNGATDARSIIQGLDGALYVGTADSGDVFKSIDGGVTWTNTGDLSSATSVSSLIQTLDAYLYAGTLPNGYIFQATPT